MNPIEALWHLDHYGGPLQRVIDLGAYVGALSIEAARRGAKEVFAIEPDADNLQKLRDAINRAGCQKTIHVLNVAVTDIGNPVKLYGAGNTSSIMFTGAGRERVIPGLSFKRLLTILAPVDYMKVDIEGAEFDCFDESDELAGLLTQVGFIEVEIHKLTGDEGLETERRDRLIEWLQDIGFDGDPCPVRKIHPGAFCSFNRFRNANTLSCKTA